MTLLDYAWVLPLLRANRYDRDGGHHQPRHRIEVIVPAHEAARQALLVIEVNCVECGRLIHPIRLRFSRGKVASMFVAVSCELARTYACARGHKAHEEYERIVAAIRGLAPTVYSQPLLDLGPD